MRITLLRQIILHAFIFLSIAVYIDRITYTADAKTIPSQTVSSKGVHPKSLNWYSEGKRLIVNNTNITIYDINTSIIWHAKYINGSNHADIIPSSAADAKKIVNNKIVGNSARRPVIVTIAGANYAGSMYAVAHGKTNYCNYFNGVMCIHFTDSKTHGTQKVDAAHQKAINTALQTKIK